MKKVSWLWLLAALVAFGSTHSANAQKGKDGLDRRVVVVNDRSSDMVRLYASRTTTDDWEENILLRAIEAGGKVVINFDDGTGACTFDFRAIFKDNLLVHMWRIDVCQETHWRIVD